MRDLFLAVLLRDLKLASRRRIESLLPVVFFIVALSLFPLGVGPEAQMLRDIAWATILTSIPLILAALLAGPAQPAVATRKALAPWLRQHLRRTSCP